MHAGTVDDETTTADNDSPRIGRGDLIQIHKNDTALGVANRQLWFVQHVADDGVLWTVEAVR